MCSNSIQCTDCQFGVKGSKQVSLFVCTVHLCPTDSKVKSCVDIVDGSSVEIVDVFCCLGDMFSVDGDVDAAVTSRICSGWFKFQSLTSFLTAKDVSLML